MFNMKNRVVLVIAIMVLTAVLAGCSQPEGQQPTGPQPGEPKLSGSITIAGSTSVAPVAEALAEEFMAIHKEVKIDVQSSGSGAGIKAAQENAADIGMSSRALKAEEKTIHETLIAKDGIVMVVHKSNQIDNITLDKIHKIYTGQIKNWNEIGGKDAPIVVVTREAGSGTRGAFEEMVMKKDPISSEAIVQGSTGAVRTAVSNDPNAIGYISLAGLNADVKMIKVEGVEGTMANIQSGSYKIARPFLFLTNKAPEGLVKEFIDFVLSSEGQKVVKEDGLVPVK
jgi:phosphate transport system substrate-binding protein